MEKNPALMDRLKKEIAALIDQLQKSDLNGRAVERQTIHHLNRLVAADEMAFDQGLADLKQFWLSSVDWCSELSKQIEKLIIMYEDPGDDEARSSNEEI